MVKISENTIKRLADEYQMEYQLLRDYAESGCKISYNRHLVEFMEAHRAIFESEEKIEQFLVTVIATAMAEKLHEITDGNPFKRITFPKP